VLSVVDRACEKLVAITPSISRVGAGAKGDRVSEWQDLAIRVRGARDESLRDRVGNVSVRYSRIAPASVAASI
jgi:hypothetical protein